jgi:hypothetical protein
MSGTKMIPCPIELADNIERIIAAIQSGRLNQVMTAEYLERLSDWAKREILINKYLATEEGELPIDQIKVLLIATGEGYQQAPGEPILVSRRIAKWMLLAYRVQMQQELIHALVPKEEADGHFEGYLFDLLAQSIGAEAAATLISAGDPTAIALLHLEESSRGRQTVFANVLPRLGDAGILKLEDNLKKIYRGLNNAETRAESIVD